MIIRVMALVSLFLLSISAAMFGQSAIQMDSPGSAEQLRLGVLAYHGGRYAESLFLFEKALAYSPGDPDVLNWLGRAYLKSGLEATALRTWEQIIAGKSFTPILRSKIEALRASRAFGSQSLSSATYIEAVRFDGINVKDIFFSRPTALLPLKDGSILVVAHGSNELFTIDVNGQIRERRRGGLVGFDRPFGLAVSKDDTIFVTEFNSDRVARIGTEGNSVFGSSGRGTGELIGPASAACDSHGYVYVVDYGNARISKFNNSGAFILSFGMKADNFDGLESPSGIVINDNVLFIADTVKKAVFRFDLSGNFLGALALGELRSPEGLSLWNKGKSILVADTTRIVSIDLETEALYELYASSDGKSKILSVAADYNGNIIMCDFNKSSISILTESSSLASGYDVEIVRVDAKDFPIVRMEVSVSDRKGNPVLGLASPNFYLSERVVRSTIVDEGGKAVTKREVTLRPVKDSELVGIGQVSKSAQVIILAERSPENGYQKTAFLSALTDIVSSLSNLNGFEVSIGLASAGKPPVLIAAPSSSLKLESMATSISTSVSTLGRFDLGLRLAAQSLFPTATRDAIIYLGSGSIDDSSFSGLTISELAALLKNNGLRFFAVTVGTTMPSSSIQYLAERTGGQVFAASRPSGLADLANAIKDAPSGRYSFSFISQADSNFGREQLGINIEAYLFKKSGRDELGYFAPLR